MIKLSPRRTRELFETIRATNSKRSYMPPPLEGTAVFRIENGRLMLQGRSGADGVQALHKKAIVPTPGGYYSGFGYVPFPQRVTPNPDGSMTVRMEQSGQSGMYAEGSPPKDYDVTIPAWLVEISQEGARILLDFAPGWTYLI